MKFEHLNHVGKLQYAVELMESAMRDVEFKEMPDDDKEMVDRICIKLSLITIHQQQRIYKK